MRKKNISGRMTVAVALVLVSAMPALALPIYTSGSMAIGAFTTTTTDVTTTKSFTLVPASYSPGTPVGSFTLVSLPASFSATSPINFLSASTFNFTNTGLGSFSAASATLLSTVSGNNASATWNVVGSFTPGTSWSNAGTLFSANETWTLNQTGGAGKAIALSATFNSPALTVSVPTPEPATLALFGAGLVGLGALRRRRKAKV